jgi:tetratricopeptide (TPR) repeat protein
MKERLAIVLLLGTIVLVYANTLWNGFTMDDELYISTNPAVTHVTEGELFGPNRVSNVFRPVTFATLALNWSVAREQPFGYHLVNLILHAGVTLLLYWVLQTILGPLPETKTVALTAAWLFAVHPIHTEAVASIVGRAELLAAGFLLAAWLLHLLDQPLSALLCFLLALLSKESAVVFLPLVLVGDCARGARKPPARYASIAGLTLLYLGLLWKVQGDRFGQAAISLLDNPLAQLPVGWRILNALRVAWKYVGLQFYPAALSCDYSFNQIPMYRDWRHTLPAALATGLALGAWTWAIRKRRRGWILAGGIYLAAFAATANILKSSGTIMGERLAYLPSAGFCLLLALSWNWLRDRQRTVAVTILGLVLAALGARTLVRNRDWKDNLTLYSAAVRTVPGSAKMHMDLGGAYMDTKQYELARAELQTALRILPDYPDALENYGLLESHLGNYQAAGPWLERALRMTMRDNPDYDFNAVNFAAVLMQTGHEDAAMELLNREIAASPKYARAWSNRAVLRYKRGEMASARADAETALLLDPGNAQARNVARLLNASSPAGSFH